MIAILILVFFIVLILLSWIVLIKDNKAYNIPGPTPLPIIGNAHLFLTGTTEFLPLLRRFQETYGDAVRVHLLHKPYVILFHPKYIEPLLTDPDLISKGVSYKFLLPWLGNGLLTSSGNRWRTHRKLLTPAFHFNILQNFLPVFLKNQKILNNKLKSTYCNGEAFDIFPVIALTALDNVTESIMGVSFNTQSDVHSKYVKCIGTVSKLIAMRIRNPVVAGTLMFKLIYKKSHDAALSFLHSHTKNVINLRRKELNEQNITSLKGNSDIGTKNKHAFLDLLLLAEINGKKIDDEHVREEVDTFMLEGHDTTASCIAFALYCLSKHPSVQEKILKEQKVILGDLDRDPSYSDLKQMKYLEMVIKETLRLYPSVPLIERMTTKDSVLAGLHIKKGTALVVDIIHMQRHPDLYGDPSSFIPERFDTESNKNAFSWLAFSAGHRNCIGQKFAMMELKVVLGAIVKQFKMLPVNIEQKLCFDLILRSEPGVKIKLMARS